MFTEELVQGFWYKQAMTLKGLKTLCGQSLEILDIGIYNYQQGPDFLNARIKIGNVQWVGHVELHLRTSDWRKHKHQADINFQNIILHIVWINDTACFTASPVLELSKFVKIQQLDSCEFTTLRYYFHCSTYSKNIIDVGSCNILRELGIKRLMYRKEVVLRLFHLAKMDYASVLWRLIFRCFGRSTNADAFETLFQSIPMHVLRLYAFDVNMLEALLMGQANLIPRQFKDDHVAELHNRYCLLKQRHGLKQVNVQMKWLRMRPRNFPTIRVVQLAYFYHQHISLVSELLDIKEISDLDKLFNVQIHPYWKNHFQFDRVSPEQEKMIGNGLRHQIILHAFVPFLQAYGALQEQDIYVNRAITWVNKLQAEQNALISSFYSLGFKANTIFDTQVLHELYLQNCLQKKCSECPRGSQLSLH